MGELLSSEWSAKVKPMTIRPFKGVRPEEMPEFMGALRVRLGLGASALRFFILTMCRSGQAREAEWNDVSFEEGFWHARARRIKNDTVFRHISLPEQAIELLKSMSRKPYSQFIFSGGDKPISDRTLLVVIRRTDVDAVVEGFRHTFENWSEQRKSAQPVFANLFLELPARAQRTGKS